MVVAHDFSSKFSDQPESDVSNDDTYMKLEEQYGCHNYHPVPVVLKSAQGCTVTDVKNKTYIDCLSAYSSLNQGHLHPAIVAAMKNQLNNLSITSRAFYNDKLGLAEKLVCDIFKYDKCLFMNTGVEAVESAIKLTRRWGYERKHIPKNEALIVTVTGNFHGRTISVISFSDDPSSYEGFGPHTPGFLSIPYGDSKALETVLEERGQYVCGVLLEPIQGEAGVRVPPKGYLQEVSRLCNKHNVLMVVDEIQTGLGRTGDLLCHFYNEEEPSNSSEYVATNFRPDVVCMGKALGGGVYPVSCVLADNNVMLNIRPGEHGSTYGGNPLACVVAMESLRIIIEEKLADRAKENGKLFESELNRLRKAYPDVIEEVRGRGLLWGVVIKRQHKAWDLCLALKENGLLAKTTHDHIIRFSPPLIITADQIEKCAAIIEKAIASFVSN